MRSVLVVSALLLACGSAAASNVSVNCDVHSDYDLALTPKSLILTRKDGAPKTVLMRQGRLFIDDTWVEVSPADRDRLVAYERQARATMPLAQQIGRDAADIAFIALGEVAKGFSNDPVKTDAKLKQARVELDRTLAISVSATHFNSQDLGKGVAEAIGDVMPMVVGDIVGGAMRAAFSGDSARLERMDNRDKRIEAIVEPRTKTLEHNAQELCLKMRTLDGIDDALQYRHDGKPLDLLQVKVKADTVLTRD